MLAFGFEVLALHLCWCSAGKFLEGLLDLAVWWTPALEQIKSNETLAGHLGESLV